DDEFHRLTSILVALVGVKRLVPSAWAACRWALRACDGRFAPPTETTACPEVVSASRRKSCRRRAGRPFWRCAEPPVWRHTGRREQDSQRPAKAASLVSQTAS